MNWDNYECDNQMTIFDFLNENQEKNEKPKVGEKIYFVGYRAWIDGVTFEFRRNLSIYKCQIIETAANTFKAKFNSEYVTLNYLDYGRRWFYIKEKAEPTRLNIMQNDLWDYIEGVYLANQETHKILKERGDE